MDAAEIVFTCKTMLIITNDVDDSCSCYAWYVTEKIMPTVCIQRENCERFSTCDNESILISDGVQLGAIKPRKAQMLFDMIKTIANVQRDKVCRSSCEIHIISSGVCMERVCAAAFLNVWISREQKVTRSSMLLI